MYLPPWLAASLAAFNLALNADTSIPALTPLPNSRPEPVYMIAQGDGGDRFMTVREVRKGATAELVKYVHGTRLVLGVCRSGMRKGSERWSGEGAGAVALASDWVIHMAEGRKLKVLAIAESSQHGTPSSCHSYLSQYTP